MKKRVILFGLLLAGLIPARAQNTNLMYQRGQTYLENTLPPSPEPTSATKYADIPFSHGLGMAEFSIPVYTLQGRELSIPVSLDYRSGGIKVDDVAGVAGLGWTLNAGGCITREVMYMPDEYNNWSFYQFPSDTMLEDLENLTNNTNTLNYLKSVFWHQKDVQPDRYRYNFCGLSGTFIITPDKDVVHLTDNGVLIEFDAVHDAFHLTGPDGTSYDFTERERGSRSQVVGGNNPTPMTGQQVNWTATTAWYLTAITSRTGLETATLSYSSAGTWGRDSYLATRSWTRRVSSGGSVTLSGPSGSLTTIQSSYEPLILDQISMNGYHVLFDYTTAGGNGYRKGPGNHSAQNFPKRLSGISITHGSIAEISNWTVTTAFGQDNRVILTGLQKYHGNDLNDRWTFTYIQHGGTSRFSQDWYGYYNAETGRSSACPYTVTGGSGNVIFTLYGDPDPQYADDMMLSTVDHDGAKTEFEYEGNAIPMNGSSNLTYVGVRVKKITVKDGTSPVRIRNFTYAQPASTAGHIPGQNLYTRVSLSRGTTSVGFGGTLSVNIWDYTLHETPVMEGPSLQDTRVVYGQVTEDVTGPDISEGSARTIYYYNTQRAKDAWINTYADRFPSSLKSEYSAEGANNYVDQAYCIPNTGEPGLLTRKEEYKYESGTYSMVSSEDITYSAQAGVDYFAGYTVHQVNYGVNAANGQVSYSDFYHYPTRMTKIVTGKPTKKVQVHYHASGSDTLTVYLGYHSANRLGSVRMEDEDGIRSIFYLYPDGTSTNTTWTELVAQNAIALPVAQQYERSRWVTYGPLNLTGLATLSTIREETTYDHFSVNGSSVLLPSGREEKRDGVLAWSESFLSYDKLGRPTSVKAQGSPDTVILWSYKSLYPVAVIENSTIGDVTAAFTGGASGLTSLAEASEPTSTQLSRVNALRSSLSSAHVTTYTFDAMLGVVTSRTDPAGIKTSFEYDGAGRLTAVKDKDGKTIEGYDYDLLDLDGDGLRSVTHKTYRTDTGNVYAKDVRYWNRLGMLKEDIFVAASGNGTDLVTAFEGDCLLHDDVRTWLSYPVTNTGGSFQSGATTTAASYHGNNKAYYYKRYERSSRDKQTGAAVPGYQGLHEASFSENVPISFQKMEWDDANGVTILGTYAPSEVRKQVQADADGRKKVSYTDQAGRLLGTALTASEDTVTFRIYDDHDRLRAVIGAGIALADTLNMWRYSYDTKGRVSSKGIPGCSREGYAYDAEDRITTISRPDGISTLTYDAFGRILSVTYTPSGGTGTVLEQHTYDSAPTAAKTLMQLAGQGYNWTGPVKGFELYCIKAELNGNGGISGNAESAMRYDDFGRLSCRVTKYPDGGILTELFTYTFPGEVATRTTRYKRGSSTDELTETLSYDIRGRLAGVTSSLKVAGTTVGTDNTAYSYDALGRLEETASTATGGITLTTTDSYTLQGWLAGRSVKKGTVTVYSETLSYDSASALSHASPAYTGLITKKSELWGSGSSSVAEEYAYNPRGQLSNTWNGDGRTIYGYDVRGNRKTEKSVGSGPWPLTVQLTYAYEGDRLIGRTGLLGSKSYTYDALGRMVCDTTFVQSGHGGGQTNIVSLAYNPVGLTEYICKDGSLLVKYLYLADGMKTSAQHSDGSGLLYRGPFVYGRSASGTLTFGSAGIAGGRITSAGVQYHVTDHLGSVVAVVKGSDGTVVESGKYADFGSRTDIVSAGTPTAATNRWHFSGKEDQEVDFDLPYTDFGARLYNPDLGRWIAPDPASEKYFDISPYAYCANNPVNLVDPDGEKIIFINGYTKKWTGAPGVGGKAYWNPKGQFVNTAIRIFRDKNTLFPDIRYKAYWSADKRREYGYNYAKEHFDELTSDLSKGEKIRFVTHSMGAAFAEGMADYLISNNVKVDALIHFEPYQATDIDSNGEKPEILSIDYQHNNDWVISYFAAGKMPDADENPRFNSTKDWKHVHTDAISSDMAWKEIQSIIEVFLYGETNH